MRKYLFFGMILGAAFLPCLSWAAADDAPRQTIEVPSSYVSSEGDYDTIKTTQDTFLATKEGSTVGIGVPAGEADAKLTVGGDLKTSAGATVESTVEIRQNLTASGVIYAQGGLVIEKVSQDPSNLTSQDDGRMWLIT